MNLWQCNDCYEFDILYTAIYFDKEDVLKYALTRYKDINDRVYSDEYGLTLLTYACKLSNVKLAHILLEHGINVNVCHRFIFCCQQLFNGFHIIVAASNP